MEAKNEVIKEARRIEEDSLYSSKGHFYASQFWSNLHLWIGIPASIMAAIAGASALSQFDYHEIIAGVLAIVVSAFSAVATFINPNEKAKEHLALGNMYNNLRKESRTFCNIDADMCSENDLLVKLKSLSQQQNDLNSRPIQVPKWAFRKARKGIDEGEAHYEID